MKNLCIEKTFGEVIRTIKKNEVYSNGIYEISNDEYGVTVKRLDKFIQTDKIGIPFMYFYNDKKFILKRKQYTFDEAFKAYEEGKEIESCYNQCKFLKNADDYFDADQIRGKWYINN